MEKKFSFYDPIFDLIPAKPVYFGELFGLSHADAKKLYESLKADGFYDDDD